MQILSKTVGLFNALLCYCDFLIKIGLASVCLIRDTNYIAAEELCADPGVCQHHPNIILADIKLLQKNCARPQGVCQHHTNIISANIKLLRKNYPPTPVFVNTTPKR